ncbi:hypothetical protein Ddye_001424, partial [Dipteronia dyeriana]
SPNVTVALDGTENFSSIGQALETIPDESDATYTIYIKEGKYQERVYLGIEKKMLYLGTELERR